ncbi:MAG: hypothetical protein RJQ09_21330 [Cyclobacteriaceae bacterium]
MTTLYTIKSKHKKFDGRILLAFVNGELVNTEYPTGLLPEQWDWLHSHWPQKEEHIFNVASPKLEVTKIEPRSVKDKTAMFCAAYKHYRGVTYQPKKLEKANLKTVVVTSNLLDIFFQSGLSNFTIDNYIKRINQTKDAAKNGFGKKHPDYWDEDYERSLQGAELQAYWQHLKSKGLTRSMVHGGRKIWK